MTLPFLWLMGMQIYGWQSECRAVSFLHVSVLSARPGKRRLNTGPAELPCRLSCNADNLDNGNTLNDCGHNDYMSADILGCSHADDVFITCQVPLPPAVMAPPGEKAFSLNAWQRSQPGRTCLASSCDASTLTVFISLAELPYCQNDAIQARP